MEIERDEFGTTTFDGASGMLELDWTDATARMTDAQFRSALERFAAHSVAHKAPNVLIDVTRFAHQMSPEVGAWRDEHVIPRYNQAGVRKMAFLLPAGAPGTVESGNPPRQKARRPFPRATSARGRRCSTGSLLTSRCRLYWLLDHTIELNRDGRRRSWPLMRRYRRDCRDALTATWAPAGHGRT